MNHPTILFEDNHLLIVNKPSGWLVQGDKTGDATLLEWGKEYIKKTYNKPGNVFLGLVHRIDRPVSGVVLFARTSKALTRCNQLFKDRTIKKTYWAVVKECPPKREDTLQHYLIKNREKNRSGVVPKERKGALLAELTYKVIAQSQTYCLLEVHPKTGRHHQIRVQLAQMGSPIKGDIKYGFKRANADKSIHLHARKLDFIHPVTKEAMSIQANVPKDSLWEAFENQ